MGQIVLARIDDRLIHGQIVTKWAPECKCTRIIIVDDDLVKVPFLCDVYELSKPNGVDVQVRSTDSTLAEWEESSFGDDRVLLLFRNVEPAKKLIEKGMKLRQLQVGGLAANAGRERVYLSVCCSEDEAALLKEIEGMGVEVYFQMVPEASAQTRAETMKNVFPKYV